jgi:hypothetical protein
MKSQATEDVSVTNATHLATWRSSMAALVFSRTLRHVLGLVLVVALVPSLALARAVRRPPRISGPRETRPWRLKSRLAAAWRRARRSWSPVLRHRPSPWPSFARPSRSRAAT